VSLGSLQRVPYAFASRSASSTPVSKFVYMCIRMYVLVYVLVYALVSRSASSTPVSAPGMICIDMYKYVLNPTFYATNIH
jgi:hypothetical protein